jgi:hypothetical protein
MNTDEDNAIGGKSLLLKDAEKKTFMCLEKRFLIRSHRRISQVEDILNVMAPSSNKEMMVPRMPEAVFLESVIVRDTTIDTLAKIVDGREG